jgi:hypothetical protein
MRAILPTDRCETVTHELHGVSDGAGEVMKSDG